MDTSSRDHFDRLVGAGIPASAMLIFGRWFQLETWLREIVYVELSARDGRRWRSHLDAAAPRRAAGDVHNAYMPSADAGDVLGYLDASHLFGLIDENWDLFARYLPRRVRWQGWADELRDIRNRTAHCRRPHSDDLGRVEQVLRNLEPCARDFYAGYIHTRRVENSLDPLALAWVDGRHSVARRLLEHAANQYDVRFRLDFAMRPWVGTDIDPDALTGTPGVLWHARWVIGGRDLRPADLWRELSDQPKVERAIVHLLVDAGSVTATFAAVDSVKAVADAIGAIFDEILITSRVHGRTADLSMDAYAEWWREGAEALPRKVQVDSALTLFDAQRPDQFSIFCA